MIFDQRKADKRKFVSLVEPLRGVSALQCVFLKGQLMPVVRTQYSLVVVNQLGQVELLVRKLVQTNRNL